MARRVFDVDLSGTVRVEFDDEATDVYGRGVTILTAHEDRERFTELATFVTVLQSLAVTLGVDNRSMGHTEGWADFPEDAAMARQIGYWDVQGYSEVAQ